MPVSHTPDEHFDKLPGLNDSPQDITAESGSECSG
jgi:hypothetical protein